MIVPILFLFQILLSGSFYMTRLFAQLATSTNRVITIQKLVFQMLSQANLSRVLTTAPSSSSFIHERPDQYVDQVYKMLDMENPDLAGRKSE